MPNLQTYYHFKLDFQKADQHTGGKWLIHGTKRRKVNQLQLKLNIENFAFSNGPMLIKHQIASKS